MELNKFYNGEMQGNIRDKLIKLPHSSLCECVF